MHICSQVEGDIDEKYDACDAIEAVLPAGTLSGAPRSACEIIEEQESEPRGVYGGALGYLDFTGNYGYLHRHPHGCQEERHRDRRRAAASS